MKLIIAGTRTFNDYDLLKGRVDKILANVSESIEIVSGACEGADKLGEKYANERGYKIHQMPAEWERYGSPAAGPIRNEAMAKYATHCIVFWDGISGGSTSMIKFAKQYSLPLRIIRY